jgi:hypothetical protein
MMTPKNCSTAICLKILALTAQMAERRRDLALLHPQLAHLPFTVKDWTKLRNWGFHLLAEWKPPMSML